MKEVKKSTGTFKSFDNTEIYFETHGEGPTIVLVYGIACLINHWHHQVSFFSQNYQVVVFDIRGHHKSSAPKDKNNFTIHACALDLIELLKCLNIEKAHFAGHSFGVPILVELNKLAPQIVDSFVLINGFVQNPIKEMFGLNLEPIYHFINKKYLESPKLWSEVWKQLINNQISMWLSAIAGGFNIRVTQFKDIEIYAKGVANTSLDAFLPLFEDLMNFNGDGELKNISARTLIISGEKDAIIPFKFQEKLHESIKGSEFVIVPYGSHCTQLDFPDYVNLKMDSFYKNMG